MTETERTRAAVTTYFDAWRARDFDRLRSVLAPEVHFVGVLGTANNAEECLAGLRGMAETIMTDLILQARVVEGADAITWFDLITANTVPIPTANWSHVEDGLITQIRVTFDPGPLAARRTLARVGTPDADDLRVADPLVPRTHAMLVAAGAPPGAVAQQVGAGDS